MRKILIALVVATTMLVGAQAAFAAVSGETSIRYNATTQRFHGALASNNAECIAGRTVKLYKKTASGAVVQGKTRSSADGGWRIDVMHAGGHYFAVAPMFDAMHATCAAVRSDVVDVM